MITGKPDTDQFVNANNINICEPAAAGRQLAYSRMAIERGPEDTLNTIKTNYTPDQMNKSEVEHLLITVKSGTEEALSLKVYKNGIIARRGCGGLPGVSISGMSFTGNSSYFDGIMHSVSQQILDQPVNHEEKIITGSLEYVAAFYGGSANGDLGERAEWTKSVALRFFMDEGTSFRHNLLGFVDGLAIEAMKATDSWYFDIVMMALENRRSTTLPEQTIANAASADEELEKDFQSYFQQVSKKDLPGFAAGKTYIAQDGTSSNLIFEISEEALTYKFVEIA